MGKETLSLCNHLVGLAAKVTQYCHLLERQGNFWAALRGSSAKPSGEVCAPGLPPLFPQQERDSAHTRVCPLFPKEGLTKVMTENFFAKPAKHNLSPETKWFPFPTPCLPPAFQIIVGRRALQPESRSDASSHGPRQTCLFSSGSPCRPRLPPLLCTSSGDCFLRFIINHSAQVKLVSSQMAVTTAPATLLGDHPLVLGRERPECLWQALSQEIGVLLTLPPF